MSTDPGQTDTHELSPETSDVVDAADAVDAPEASETEQSARAPRAARLEAEGDTAADYLEELLDIVDLDGDLVIGVEGDRAVVSIVGDDLGHLAGPDGEVLEALQELTRMAVHRESGERSRLMLDVADFRAGRRATLVALAEKEIEGVRASGEAASLEPMSAFERKVVHDAVAAAGLSSESEGAEPRRYVVILPSR